MVRIKTALLDRVTPTDLIGSDTGGNTVTLKAFGDSKGVHLFI